MTRFTTTDGTQLGTRFFAGRETGTLRFVSNQEWQNLFSLNEDEIVVSDNGWTGTVGDLFDLFSQLRQASDEEMEERGWGDRLESGLSLRQSVTSSGELVWMR